MSEQILIVVTPDDRFVEYAPREECHRGEGRLHRALAGVIFDDRGQILLQRRKAHLWDNYWDITAATHPLHLPEGDESYEQAMSRCMEVEWNAKAKLEQALAFIYQAPFGDDSENEYCVLMVGQVAGGVCPNPEHVYEFKWVDFASCAADLARHPESYTPWARIAIEALDGHPLTNGVVAAA